MKSADQILGLEYDWLACDAVGHVAQFSTAGGGYAPEAFLQDIDAYDEAIDMILASPKKTQPRSTPGLPAPTDTWLEMAERGIFAFDSDFHGGPYRLVAAPEVPVRLTALPDSVAAIVRRIVLTDLRFADLLEISAERLQVPNET